MLQLLEYYFSKLLKIGFLTRNSRIELGLELYEFQSRLKLQPCFLIGGDHSMRTSGNYFTA